MIQYREQIQRIKDKLIKAKLADKDLKVFGAGSHKYIINKPATLEAVTEFENKYSIELPDCYKTFVLELGNGGQGYSDSAAGPFYGIYPFAKNIDEFIDDDKEIQLNGTCIISPKMTDEHWENLTRNINDNEEIADEDYNAEIRKLWGGILPIGSQGCSYFHGIVLSGQFKGRIVNIDLERQKPKFAFETNFLDWYERWLNEVISGDLIKNNPSWFGYVKGGSEEQLLTSLTHSNNSEDKKDNLYGLLNKNKLSDKTLNDLENIIKNNHELQNLIIRLLCKSNYEKAKPYLIKLTQTDLLTVFQCIYLYTKDKSNEWLPIIEEDLHKIKNAETFRYATYILEETNADIGKLIEPLIKSEIEDIRNQTFYTLGKLKNKNEFITSFIEGLKDNSSRVVLTTLQALAGIKDNKLMPYYLQIAQRFPTEEVILTNLNYRVSEYNQISKNQLKKSINATTASVNIPQKKWYEFWK